MYRWGSACGRDLVLPPQACHVICVREGCAILDVKTVVREVMAE